MIRLETDLNSSMGTIRMEGSITIESAAELREALLKALDEADRVSLDAEAVSAADISCFQLLCSAHRRSIELEKKMVWKSPASEAFRKAAAVSGFSRHIGCPHNGENGCLWKDAARPSDSSVEGQRG